MKVKEISVKIGRSFAYQTVSVGQVVEVGEGEDVSEATKRAINECKAHCLSEIAKIKEAKQ